MRTDVKVGLICCLILIAAVGLYFAFTPSPNKTTPADSGGAASPSQLTTEHPAAPHADTPSSISVAPASAPGGVSIDPSGATPIVGPSSLAVAPASGPAPLEAIGPGTGSLSSPPPLSSLAATEPATLPRTSLATGGPGSLIPPPPAPTGLTESRPTGPGSPSGNRGTLTIEGAPPASLPSPSSGRSGRSSRRGGLLGNDNPTPSPGGRSGTPAMPMPTTIAPPPPAGAAGSYTIVHGDTLSALAKKNHVTLAALKAANPGINYNVLKLKQVIKIPAPSATPAPAATRPGRVAATRPAATTRPGSARGGAAARPLHTPAPGSTYVVKKGDNLRAIAKAAYGDENMWRAIARTNRGELPHPNALVPGTVLHLPSR